MTLLEQQMAPACRGFSVSNRALAPYVVHYLYSIGSFEDWSCSLVIPDVRIIWRESIIIIKMAAAAGAVKCPVCSGEFQTSEINSHLDTCLDQGWKSGEEKEKKKEEESVGPPAKKTRVSSEAKSGLGAGTSGPEVKPNRPSGAVFSMFNNNNNNKSCVSYKQAATEVLTRGTASPSNAAASASLPGSAPGTRKRLSDESEALNQKLLNSDKPLAEKMRPSTMEEYFGQNKVLGEHTLLRALLQSQEVPSLILWGPPGCGKVSDRHPQHHFRGRAS